MRYFVTLAGRTYEVELGADGVMVDGAPARAELAHVDGTQVHSLVLDGASHRLVARKAGRGGWDLVVAGRRYAAEAVDERTRVIREMTGASAAAAGPRPVRAPMPGLVVKVEVEAGDEVQPGQGLIIVEAMKMENELKAEGTGRVSRILAGPGEAVEKDQILIELAPVDGDDGAANQPEAR